MEIIDWCFKVEKIVRLRDGKCSHDAQYGCPYRGTPLCLLKVEKDADSTRPDDSDNSPDRPEETRRASA